MPEIPGRITTASELDRLEQKRAASLSKNVLHTYITADSEEEKQVVLRRAAFVMLKKNEFN